MILQVENVSKRFGGLQALQDVSFGLPEGQILGLIGPNGAGKTTMFNVISGVYPPEGGRVIFRGEEITGLPPYEIARRGLARTHQIVRPLNELTVRQNVMVGACYGREQLSSTAAPASPTRCWNGSVWRSGRTRLAGSLNVARRSGWNWPRAGLPALPPPAGRGAGGS